ncbi:MAG: MFS transporter [Chloroflexota bacterium]|nr:MFS transporter [Chloroflexota bacterium]
MNKTNPGRSVESSTSERSYVSGTSYKKQFSSPKSLLQSGQQHLRKQLLGRSVLHCVKKPTLKPVRVPVRIHTFDTFRSVNYRFLWLSTVIFSGAFWLQQVLIGWLAYDITGSPFLTSIIMGLDALPILLGAPLGGLICDRFDKRRLLAMVYTYQAILMVTFSVIIMAGLGATWNIFGFVFLMGIAWTIHDPARMALITTIVPREKLINAFALNAMAFSIMRLTVPAAGGLLLGVIGAWPIFLLEAILMVGAGLIIQLIKTAKPIIPPTDSKDKRPAKSSLKTVPSELLSGIGFISRQPIIIGFMCLTLLMVILIVPFINGLMPVYAAEIFEVGPGGLGLLFSSAGLGSLLSTVILASWKRVTRPGVVTFSVLAFLVVLMIAMSINQRYEVALGITMAISGAMMAYFSIASATVQSILPDNLRGKVTGIYMMASGLIPVGALTAGIIANEFGAPVATRLGAILAVCALSISFVIFRDVWNYRSETSTALKALKQGEYLDETLSPQEPTKKLAAPSVIGAVGGDS